MSKFSFSSHPGSITSFSGLYTLKNTFTETAAPRSKVDRVLGCRKKIYYIAASFGELDPKKK